VNAIQDTTVDLVLAGHTHRVSNMMVGRILVAEGYNAGASYSVAQLVVHGGDVEWAGSHPHRQESGRPPSDPT